MNHVFKQHNQHVENHSKFARCARVFELAKLKCNRQTIRRIKSDRTPKRKEQLKINNDESIQFKYSIVVIMVIELAKTVL